MKTRIIGHRGAAGLALENTVESIRSAKKAGVDAIEIDIRLTKDRHFVLSHDPNTARTSETNKHISQTSFKQFQKLKLHNGEHVPSLDEAMRTVGDTHLVIEAKGSSWAHQLAETLDKRTKNISVIAFNHDELARFNELRPRIPTYALERWSPFDVIQTAKQNKFTGIDLNFWILNPLTYWLARRAGLEIIVFTVDRVWLATFLKALYPRIAITTNYPDRLQLLRKNR